VADRVIFHPHSRRVETFFAAADAFVFPTLYDSFGLVICEAMASGLPVVTSRAAGAAELITDGEDGLLTDQPWDADAIAAHLARLRDDPGLRERLSVAGRARIEPFTWDRTAEQTLAVYRRAMAGGK
jgi:UDP-glucose:(heptosyl)LPS alpha-1,3-glucosyltransferase